MSSALEKCQAAYDAMLPDEDDERDEIDCKQGKHDWRYDSGNSEMTFYRCACCGLIDER